MSAVVLLIAVAGSDPRAVRRGQTPTQESVVVRLDPALDAIVTADARVERVATGFGFTEGPVWVRKGGFLIFSDIPANVIHRWSPSDGRV
jgi:hypothetical protein